MFGQILLTSSIRSVWGKVKENTVPIFIPGLTVRIWKSHPYGSRSDAGVSIKFEVGSLFE